MALAFTDTRAFPRIPQFNGMAPTPRLPERETFMAITEVREDSIDQVCAQCSGVRTIAFSEVEVGVVRDSQADSSIVPLPACLNCEAQEYLLCSRDDEDHPSPGSYGHLHRLLVDTLHGRLVKKGRVAKGLDDKSIPEREPSAEVLAQWFKDGLKLPKTSKAEGKGK